jgi:hypothetical protein
MNIEKACFAISLRMKLLKFIQACFEMVFIILIIMQMLLNENASFDAEYVCGFNQS